jgi:hypothetical protein
MNSDQSQKAKDLFEAALRCPPDKRRRFLDESYGGDADVRRQVESLLAASDDAASFLEQTVSQEVAETMAGQKTSAGKTLGHYKILSQRQQSNLSLFYRLSMIAAHRMLNIYPTE